MTSRSVVRRAWALVFAAGLALTGCSSSGTAGRNVDPGDLGAQVHVRLPASACTVLPAGGR